MFYLSLSEDCSVSFHSIFFPFNLACFQNIHLSNSSYRFSFFIFLFNYFHIVFPHCNIIGFVFLFYWVHFHLYSSNISFEQSQQFRSHCSLPIYSSVCSNFQISAVSFPGFFLKKSSFLLCFFFFTFSSIG